MLIIWCCTSAFLFVCLPVSLGHLLPVRDYVGGRKPNNFTCTLLEVAPSVVLAPLPLPLASVLQCPPKCGSPSSSRLRTSYVYVGHRIHVHVHVERNTESIIIERKHLVPRSDKLFTLFRLESSHLPQLFIEWSLWAGHLFMAVSYRDMKRAAIEAVGMFIFIPLACVGLWAWARLSTVDKKRFNMPICACEFHFVSHLQDRLWISCLWSTWLSARTLLLTMSNCGRQKLLFC